MESIVLTIAERLKDLRKSRGITLEALAKDVAISKSALGTYETGEFKDISPLSIVKLAEYYGVTTDYLMGVSNLEKEADTEIQELRLTNGALDVLKSGGFNRVLLSEIMCHKDFQRLMVDMEIFVDHIASMQVDNLNYVMGTTRDIVQKQYHADENELFYRTAELGKIPADEYVSSVFRIICEGEGSSEERAAKLYLAALGIDYDSLTHEEFVVLIGILEKSELKENSISRRGRNRPTSHKKRKK